MAKTLTGSTLAKHLASCNKPTRDKALNLLKTWLPSQPQISNPELKNLWKGLFYCVWHADKQQTQLDLINRLSSLLVTLDLPLSIQFFEIFVLTIRREWSGIDSLRLDKFYLLIRKFVGKMFLVLRKNGWDLDLVNRFVVGVLVERSFLSKDRFPAQGVNYYICQVWLEEMAPFLPVKAEVFEALVCLFVSVLGKSLDKVLLSKVRISVFDCLVRYGKKVLEVKKGGEGGKGGEVGKDVEVFGAFALKLGFSVKFFEMGSSEDCVQGNRKVLFGLHQEFEKMEKEFVSSGIEVEVPIVENRVADEDDEVPELIPITQVEVGDSSKKRKKAKKSEVLVEQMEVDNGSAVDSTKKKKSGKKAFGGMKKSMKKNKNAGSDSVVSEVEVASKKENISNGGSCENNGDLVTFNETVISNLQKEFEKVAALVGMDTDAASPLDSPQTPVNGSISKKRKRAKSNNGKVSVDESPAVVGSAIGKSGDKSAKKVRFSMKSNLVWKPHSPLPPQDLRLPPSATPRGSALKKGLPPGPVMDTPMLMKVKRKATSVKKVRKGLKSISPAVKRLKKLRSSSV